MSSPSDPVGRSDGSGGRSDPSAERHGGRADRFGGRYAIELAGPQDAADLLRLYECGDFAGRVSVLYTRRPDPFASLAGEGHRVVVPIVRDTERGVIIGMGACVVRRAYVNGAVRTVGYLTGLKGLPEYRRRVPIIPRMYAFLREQTRDEVELYYTTILSENADVARMLEKRRPTMPEYRPVGGYTTYCFRGVGHRGRGGYRLTGGSVAALLELSAAAGGARNLAPAQDSFPGLSDADVYLLRDRAGAVVAGCGVWDQRRYKQHIVTGYAGAYRYLKRLPCRWLGYPDLPREHAPVNYASLVLVTVRDDDARVARALLGSVAAATRGYGFLALGLADGHPLADVLRAARTVRYGSRLYTVHWEPDSLALDGRPIGLEVGQL